MAEARPGISTPPLTVKLVLVNEASSFSSSILSPATAQALEFPSLLAVVSRFAASDLGRERALGLRPFEEEAPLRARRILFEEASRLVGERALVPDFDVPLSDLLTGIATGRPPVEGLDLVRLADLGRATRAAAARSARRSPRRRRWTRSPASCRTSTRF